jgi:hypothetical protein
MVSPNSINRLGFLADKYYVSCEVQTVYSAHTVYLCVPFGSHNKQRFFPQRALTGCAL